MIQVEQLERRVLADRQGLIASGVREGLPDLATEQERFDAYLIAEPETRAELSAADLVLLEERIALGVA